jgi:hypothetical protein
LRIGKVDAGRSLTLSFRPGRAGRRADDACWPGPVWGQGEARAYDDRSLQSAIAAALTILRAMQAAA